MRITVHTLTVHFQNSPDEQVEVYDPKSDHPKDVKQIATEKARLIEMEPGMSARDRPDPTWAEHESQREVEVSEIDE